MDTTLHTEARTTRGKNEARRLRRRGQIPGVVYGDSGDQAEREAVAISVDPAALLQIFRSDSGANTLIGLTIDSGEASQVLIKDYQVHPLTRELLHVDFYRVAMDKVLAVNVPFVLTGEAEGVKVQGGLIEFVQREMEVECLPTQIPEHITVDVSALMIGQGVRVRDVIEGVPWRPLSDVETLIVHVIAPKVEEEPEEAEAEEGAEDAAATPEGEEAEKTEKADDGGKSGD